MNLQTLNTLFIKHRQKLIILLTVILMLSVIFTMYSILFIYPISNDECLWKENIVKADSSVIFIIDIKKGGVTDRAGIKENDILLGINNIYIKNSTHAQVILNSLNKGDFATYTIKRDSSIFQTKVEVKKLINFQELAYALTSFLWLFIGFIALMAKSNGRIQLIFYLMGVSAALYTLQILFLYSLMSNPNLLTSSWFLLRVPILLGALFFPFYQIKFFWNFPKQFNFAKKVWVDKLLFWLPFLTAILIFLLEFYQSRKGYTFFVQTFTISISIIYIFNALGYSIGFISLLINFFKIKDKSERRPLIFITAGYTIGFLSYIYIIFFANTLAGNIYNHPEYYMPIVFIILLPISFVYSIFKYQLLDVSIVIKNTVIYLFATLSLGLIYFITIFLLGQSISSSLGTQYEGLIAAIIFILFAFLFQSTKDKFHELLTKRFYPEQFAYQQILIKFINELQVTTGLENILYSMQKTFVDALRLDKFGLILFNPKYDNIIFKNCYNIDCNKISTFKNSYKLFQKIKSKKSYEKYIFIDQTEFPVYFENDAEILIKEGVFTIIPMFINERLIGLILLGLKASGSQFGGKDIELLSTIASQAAISIENAKYYENEKKRISLERDLETAREIQQNLLPKKFPEIKGLDIFGKMLPASHIGGDYFDVLKKSEKKLFVIIGDVSGKGLPASLHMTRIQTMMQTMVEKSDSPKDILLELNKKLYNTFERNWFVTLSLALFDLENNFIRFARAGHTPLIAYDGNELEYIKPNGIGLGLESGKIFEKSITEQIFPIKNNSYYIFYSDGVTESMNKNNELFGEDNLSNIIRKFNNYSSRICVEMIINELTEFRGEKEQNDDITLVIINTDFS